MSWLFSQVLVEEYLGDISSDGEQSAPLSGSNTQQAYCAPDKMTKFSRLSRFGMTYKPLMESRGEELLTLYLADFHAKTSAQQGGGGFTGSRSSMWRHRARIIGEVRPQYAFVENSPMLTTRGLGVVLADLSTLGFDAKWGVVSAADVGANHQRERIWIRAEQRNFLSHTEHNGIGRRQQQSESTQETDVVDTKSCGGGRNAGEFSTKDEQQTCQRQEGRIWQSDNASEMVVPYVHGCVATEITASTQETIRQQQAGAGNPLNIEGASGVSTTQSDVANSNEFGTQSQSSDKGKSSEWIDSSGIGNRNWWTTEPNVGRVANGISARVDRLKAIGNGQVPLCAATAWELLK